MLGMEDGSNGIEGIGIQLTDEGQENLNRRQGVYPVKIDT